MKNLSNKVALVTGASRGIGTEVALHLAKAGAKVIINYSVQVESSFVDSPEKQDYCIFKG